MNFHALSFNKLSFNNLSSVFDQPSVNLCRVSLLGLGMVLTNQAVGALTVSSGSLQSQTYSQYPNQSQHPTQYPQTYQPNASASGSYSSSSHSYQQSSSYNNSSYQTTHSSGQHNTYNQQYNNQYASEQYQAKPYNKNLYNNYQPLNDNPSPNQYGSVNSGYGSYHIDNSVNYFSEARQAGSRQDNMALYEYEQKMQGGLFAMYPEYWRLNNQIDSLAPTTVINFAKRYPKAVMAEKLVADYAENKAKIFDYQAIQQVAPYVSNADASEACALAIGNIYNRGSKVAEQKSKVWLNTLKQPALCDQFASALNDSSLVNRKDRQARLFRMLRLGKTGDIISLSRQLGTPIDYAQLQSIQYDSRLFFTQFTMQPYSQINQYLYLYAIGRMTENAYPEAAMQINYDVMQDNQRPQRLLDKQTQRMAYRTIAVKRMNMNTNDGFHHEAVDWFRKSLGEPFNYEEAEDYAMAGIRFSEWQDVINAITSMTHTQQQKDIWQYWLARAYEQTGKQRKARSLYKQVAKKNNYYGFLAKDKLGMAVDLSSMTVGSQGIKLPDISAKKRREMFNNSHFARAFALHDINKQYAKREWNWGVRQAVNNKDFDLLLAAARHAHDIGWYDRSIYAMEIANEELNKINVAISHPTPRKYSVINYARQAGIDPAWAYGIMRQESRFNVSARSNVGAGGLMQIMPATGRHIARQLGERYSASKVANGDTNIRYGTWYMGDVLNDLGGQAVLATAGYNAGPNKAKRWQPEFRSLSADQYVDTIPYPETRNYVKRVMENSTIYGNLLGRPQSLQQRMGSIAPKY